LSNKSIVKSGKKFIIIFNITNPITPAFIPYFKNNQDGLDITALIGI